MLRIMLSGCNGQMGRAISELASSSSTMTVVAGVDRNTVKLFGYSVYADPREYNSTVDVLVDFSNPSSLESLLDYCINHKVPVVLATTGYSESQVKLVEAASEKIPIFRTANMSVGVSLITELAKQTAKLLGYDYNIEIIEKHHNKKLDSPSGTALAIAESLTDALPEPPQYVYGRHGTSAVRQPNEIGIHAVRGGTIIGDHEILFAGNDEVIEIKHSAISRGVFAGGALKAAGFIAKKTPGLYTMNDLVVELLIEH